ncbi:peptidase inhibitor family I36 protein [Couchioplanes azureus]|uniref:peptidase inhibitor family I36 protein n=1 Tax=Couchioplanes caeruleus TaxID=56438 RepID=UPI001670E3C6|nr:peptidase inhibitor family I36 protein [Couchioplanes caeruleus]GGQ77108.1 hypothetical protein GCM10010166_53820 [Couchioplanes caeruleus subsp. azureus]
MKRILAAMLATVAGGIALLATSGAAAVAISPDATQQKIDKLLAQHPDAIQTSRNTVSWQQGDVVLTLARTNIEGVQTADAAPCPDGRFCLYADANFGGDSVSFRDRLCDNRIINLPSFNFNDITSSWANNTDFDVDVWSDVGAGGPRLFQMFTLTESSGLPKNINDRASSLNCF